MKMEEPWASYANQGNRTQWLPPGISPLLKIGSSLGIPSPVAIAYPLRTDRYSQGSAASTSGLSEQVSRLRGSWNGISNVRLCYVTGSRVRRFMEMSGLWSAFDIQNILVTGERIGTLHTMMLAGNMGYTGWIIYPLHLEPQTMKEPNEQEPIQIDIRNATRTQIPGEKAENGFGVGQPGDPSPTLTGAFVPAVQEQILVLDQQGGKGQSNVSTNIVPTLGAATSSHALTSERSEQKMNEEPGQLSLLSTSSVEDSPVRICQLREKDVASLATVQDYGGNSIASLVRSLRPGWSSKMSLAFCRRTTDEILPQSFGGWRNAGTGGRTGFWTASISEWPNDGAGCSLSDILEPPSPHLERYFLSGRACKGILRRADERQKTLPSTLQAALEAIVLEWERSEQETSTPTSLPETNPPTEE